ncbi:AbrB/MazE/SpoVT family DNA-binding domain-containing protein [Candidatus Woesearchaeota archaeon]|nr:AbrB/MazE/SpoVT family DNA-binding domain-containing protein [Candidatus Woesearchaeota archaeon]
MKCPVCKGNMSVVKDVMPKEKVGFEAYKCENCGEELVNMAQLKSLAQKYRELRRAKDVRFAKWGNSLAIRIPTELVDELGIHEGMHALIRKEKEALKIMPG